MAARDPVRTAGFVILATVFVIAAAIAAPVTAEEQPADAVRVAGNSAVRTITPYVRQLVEEGVRRSPTFATEVRELSSSDVIVVVEPSTKLPHGICGHTTFLAATGGFRYLKVLFDTRYNVPRTIGIIGHELRHAIEVATHREVVDQKSLCTMYEHIGYRNSWSRGLRYDSAAAISAGRTIVDEVLSPPVNATAVEAATGR